MFFYVDLWEKVTSHSCQTGLTGDLWEKVTSHSFQTGFTGIYITRNFDDCDELLRIGISSNPLDMCF